MAINDTTQVRLAMEGDEGSAEVAECGEKAEATPAYANLPNTFARRRLRTFANPGLSVGGELDHLAQLAHVEPRAAALAFDEMVALEPGNAVASPLRNYLNCGIVGTLMRGGGIGAILEAFPIPLGSVN
jgi:hypothetical protein